MNMCHRHLVSAGAKILDAEGVEVALPERPSAGYPESYPVDIEILPSRTYKGENLEEFKGATLTSPVIIN
jgi:hypothetical protein